MIKKQPLCSQRVRRISGSFAFIEHRFVQHGFWESLDHHELLLYLFLVIVADRNGLSYYGYDRICTMLRMSVDEYLLARNTLIEKDLIAFDGHLFQALSLPEKPLIPSLSPLKTQLDMEKHDPATVGQIIAQSLSCKNGRVGKTF